LVAAHHGDLVALRCLRRLGCPCDLGGSTLMRAVTEGCTLQVLKWLHGQGCPVEWQ
jgi:hypothetical protein